MSYRCHIGAPLAQMMRVEPGGPWVTCDCCGARISIALGKPPPKWLLDGKPPKGWTTTAHADGTRTDTCGACRKSTRVASRKATR